MNQKLEQQFINWAKEQLNADAVVAKEPHGDQSTVFRLQISNGNYFLKVGSRLTNELERLEWLSRKCLPVPKVIGFTQIETKDALLLSAIEGANLANLCKEWPTEKLIEKLADTLHQFHAADISDCPFGKPGINKVLVHGDACLPNFIFHNDSLSGYIDLGDMRIDNPDVDLSAAVWSLEYNLGSGHGLKFLQKYGVQNASENLVENLKLQYEKMQEDWGL